MTDRDPRAAERAVDHPVVAQPTIPRLFETAANRYADRPARAYKGGVYDRSLAPAAVPEAPDGAFATLAYGEDRRLVRRLAAGFAAMGIDSGDRVGLYADTRMEWAQCDLGVLAAGGAVTTVYPRASTDMVEHVLGDAGAVAVVVENGERLDRLRSVADALDVVFAVTMDDVDDARDDPPDHPVAGEAGVTDADELPVYSLAAVHERGRQVWDREAYEDRVAALDPESLATLIYTSGTTGTPKGVRLTHGNLRSNLAQCYRRFGRRPGGDGDRLGPDSRLVSVLPLAHVFERLTGHFLPLAAGAQVAYAASPETLQADFAAVEPTHGTSVPWMYERIFEAVREQAADSAIGRRLFPHAVDVARRYARADDPSLGLRLAHAAADRLVYRRVRDALGGSVSFLISGGSSLPPDRCATFHGFGVDVLEGYGLTETSPVVAANPPGDPEIGTVGPPVVDCEVRVDEAMASDSLGDDAAGEVGELLVRGPNVSDGYWQRPGETIAGEDGWFRTGDVGEIRPDGYLRFVERATELLTLSTGKNVPPGPVETALESSPLIEQALVVGDDRPYVGALLVPDVTAVRSWASDADVDLAADLAALCDSPVLRDRMETAVATANESVEEHMAVAAFELVPGPFTEASGLLTPTLKKRRGRIAERYAGAVASLYAD
ncbi:MAG: long-chain fatty acid--CoA ligase [Halobacteriaceae archaeon]